MQHVASNNVAICCVQMLLSFGRNLQMLGYVALRCCFRLTGALGSFLTSLLHNCRLVSEERLEVAPVQYWVVSFRRQIALEPTSFPGSLIFPPPGAWDPRNEVEFESHLHGITNPQIVSAHYRQNKVKWPNPTYFGERRLQCLIFWYLSLELNGVIANFTWANF